MKYFLFFGISSFIPLPPQRNSFSTKGTTAHFNNLFQYSHCSPPLPSTCFIYITSELPYHPCKALVPQAQQHYHPAFDNFPKQQQEYVQQPNLTH
mmetsp:Transcript_134/g.167  ORF Transcript_134/g.167 Transcript_134/m.167 type:complete len:95 (+) Transcript_134:50-334(+)